MVSTFVNPTVNPDSRLGVRPFDEAKPVRLWPGASTLEVEIVIQAIYRQVFGNAYIMESERLATLESRFTQGELSVREFVRGLAKSELYRTRFFEACPRYRSIELNFKHLLGRAPENYQETTLHSHLLDTAGYDADIDAYVDSDEYQQVFGEDMVPYYRGYKTQTGKSLVGFTYMSKLLRGSSSSDKDLVEGNSARLTQAILTNTPSRIEPPTNISPSWRPVSDAKDIIARALGVKNKPARPSLPISSKAPLTSQPGDIHRRKQYDGLQVLAGDPIELCPGFSAEEAEILIRAVYRQVLGNAYVMESERLQIPESQLKQGRLSVREFIRWIAKSELYRSRFVDNCYRYRSIELNFKHFLGRAPISFEEMKYHSTILDESGFEADIDSYLDGDEYQKIFGENLVPYYRGYKTQIGQPLIGFTNTLQLLRSASSSDKALASGNAPQLTRAIILNRPYGIDRARDAEDILRDVFKSKTSMVDRQQQIQKSAERNAAEQVLTQTIQQQSHEIESLQQQLADLRPVAMMGAAHLKDDWGLSTLPENSGEASSSLQQRVDFQSARIATLQAQISDAHRYEMIGEFQLNKWRSRIFKG